MANVVGSANTGLQPDTWYSIQSYATDYYIGVGNSSSISQLSSGRDDTSLWQFISGSDTGSYAIRSKSSGGLNCLYSGPILQPCDLTSTQYRVFTSASDENADILVPSLEDVSAALYALSTSPQGDFIRTANLDPLNVEEVELFFAIQSVSDVDTSAYPTTLPSPSPSTTSSASASQTTLTTSTSQSTSSSALVSPISPLPPSPTISSASRDVSSPPAPTLPAAPSTESSTVVITQDAPGPTESVEQATSTVIVDPVATAATTTASAAPSVELSTGAGAALKTSGVLMALAAVVGVWLS